jgi:hypothetical protein
MNENYRVKMQGKDVKLYRGAGTEWVDEVQKDNPEIQIKVIGVGRSLLWVGDPTDMRF